MMKSQKILLRLFRYMIAMACLAAAGASADAKETILLPNGSNWNYLDDGSDQGTAWRSSSFDDSKWQSGPAPLGYGGRHEVTVVGHIDTDPEAPGTQKNATTYFRSTFNVADLADLEDLTSLVVTLTYDDGGAIFINGNEVARTSNLAKDAAYNTFTSSKSANNSMQSWTLLPDVLVQGRNTIAVEIHQYKSSSSDISFDLKLAASDEAPGVPRGPYLQSGTPTSVVVRWSTDVPTDSRVIFGQSPDTLTKPVTDETMRTEHEVTLTGLTPATRYYYAIGSTTKIFSGGEADLFFDTSPVVGAEVPIRIWVLGDSGTANKNQKNVRDAYYDFTKGRHTNLWLMLGDNAYNSGKNAEYQAAVFDIYGEMLRKSVLWATLGNHDARARNSEGINPYFEIFTFPTDGSAGGVASGTEHYYSFDYGNIHFICLDSQTSDRSVGGAMHGWLTNDLEQTTQKWIIAFWHHPPYSKGSHDSDSKSESHLVQMRENFLPLLESHGVDLVLAGHSHSYERSKLLDGFYATPTLATSGTFKDSGNGRWDGDGAYRKNFGPRNGAVYTVAGSSGKTSGGPLNHPVMVASLNVLGSLVLDVNGNRLDAKFIDDQGAIQDDFTIIKESPSP